MDLTPYKSKPVLIRFRLASNQYPADGWYIDDVEIKDIAALATSAAPAGGVYGSAQNVTLTPNRQATIYYTTDGTIPTVSSSVYSTPIPITATTTLKYFAKDLAGNLETVKTQLYTIDTIAPTGGTVAANAGAATTNSATVTLTLAAADTQRHRADDDQ